MSQTSKVSIVTPDWVAAHAADTNLRILDVRRPNTDYFLGHLPNAVSILDETLRGPLLGVPVQYQSAEILALLLARAGVNDHDPVVIYADGEGILGATMVAYILERSGHPQIMVMDGGWAAYKAGHPTTQEYPQYKAGSITIKDNSGIAVTLDEVKQFLETHDHKFIDARPEDIYSGRTKIWMRNGHIPGAVSLDWHLMVDAANEYRLYPLDALRQLVAAKGIQSTDDIVLYCGTSREASLNYLVLKHLLGFPKVRLYEGSWTEYSARLELPIEIGPNT